VRRLEIPICARELRAAFGGLKIGPASEMRPKPRRNGEGERLTYLTKAASSASAERLRWEVRKQKRRSGSQQEKRPPGKKMKNSGDGRCTQVAISSSLTRWRAAQRLEKGQMSSKTRFLPLGEEREERKRGDEWGSPSPRNRTSGGPGSMLKQGSLNCVSKKNGRRDKVLTDNWIRAHWQETAMRQVPISRRLPSLANVEKRPGRR